MTLYKLYQTAYTPYEWHKELFDYAHSIDIPIFSTPFDHTAVTLLEELDTPIYKIASFEINDIPLIENVASKGKPIIMSTGIATEDDINEALTACRKYNNNDIILLKCTSAYPTPLEEVNLKTMVDYKSKFNVRYGLSDHTMGSLVSVAAVSLGACLIEKHVILDKSLGGPDAAFSLDTSEFKKLIEDVRAVETALGRVTYDLTKTQIKSREHSRSLFVALDMKAGEVITSQNVRSVRPGFGLHTRHHNEIIGKKVKCDLTMGTPFDWKYLD